MLGFSPVRRKPREFEYKPRHYDPEKEAREQRRRELLGYRDDEQTPENYVPGQYIRRDMMYRRGVGHSSDKKSNPARRIRLFIFLALIILLGYWIFS